MRETEGLEFKPYPYQDYCIRRILDTEKIGLFLDMGLGKTVVTLTAIRKLMLERFEVAKVLIIAPKKVAEATWTKESLKWAHTRLFRIAPVLGSTYKRLRALYSTADLYVINRENVPWLVDFYRNNWPFDMVVVDESSGFKNPRAKRFKYLAAVSPHIRRMVLLSGTPSPNSLLDLWSQVYLLDGGQRLEKRFTQYRERYFNPGRRGNNVIYDYRAKEGASSAVLGKIGDICISLKSEDYLDLPELVTQDVPVMLNAMARKAYAALERDLILSLPEAEDITVAGAAALSNKLLQLSNGALYGDGGEVVPVHDCKLQAFLELVEALNGEHALVFWSFRHDRDRLLAALAKTGLSVAELKGPAEETAWNAGKIDLLLAHPASCAYGLNLQAGGRHCIWFGLTWSFELYAQAVKRLHRQGQKGAVIIHRLICQDTRDEEVVKALEKKDGSQAHVLESLKARIREVRRAAKKIKKLPTQRL